MFLPFRASGLISQSIRASGRRSLSTRAYPMRKSSIALATIALTFGAAYYSSKEQPVLCSRPFLNMSDWTKVQIENIENTSHNTKIFRFKLPSKSDSLAIKVNGAVLAKNDKDVTRPYTPISDPNEKGYFDLLIKHYKDGPMTEYLWTLKEGDHVEFKGNLQKDEWKENGYDKVYLFAGGSGITPMYQLIHTILENPKEKTGIVLVDCNMTEKDILLKEKLDAYENKYPQRFKAVYMIDTPEKSYTAGPTGRITEDIVKKILPDPAGKEKFRIYVCGPPGFYKALSGPKVSPKDQGELTGILKELGYKKENVYKF